MKANVKTIQKSRLYSEEFKREIVSFFEKGNYSVLQISRLYGISCPAIYKWIYKFSIFSKQGQRIVEMKASNTNKVKELEAKVRELERIVGQKQIQVDFYSKLIEIASEELDYDIIKNSNTPQSTGSAKKENK
ncbi:transposase [Myroides sp. 1354]|uniref:transposase n=1 Tax=unclassified Myroides TaxID=2642485 RepID=UPI002575EFCD|nr:MULTISPECIES: transposase [unclassified Myroides]MDM1046630.1 transposase [Myroides sp. R163-1]MDM1057570.1 transposase [Myroides sp. 1354]MDM1070860.1 transposase [Myroides sp. 1372]